MTACGGRLRHASPCPWCGRRHDGGDPRDPDPLKGVRPPEAGQVTVCLCCARPSVMARDGAWRRPRWPETSWLQDDPEAVRLVAVARMVARLNAVRCR